MAELYIALVEWSRQGDCDLLAFEGEPACWRHLHGHGGELVTLKPDAYVCLGIDDAERSAFIEMDMASEALPTVQSKCQRYIDYWRSGREQQAHGVFPVVLWLVPNERRRDRVVEVIHRLTVEARALFAVAVQTDGAALLAAAAGDPA